MPALDTAFRVDSLSLDDVTGIFYGASNPSSLPGFDAPLGSLYIRTSPSELWNKTGASLTNWTKFVSGSGSILTKDEGVTVVPLATSLNFVGAGVTVTDAGSNGATVTIGDNNREYAGLCTPAGGITGNSSLPINGTIPLITDGTQLWSRTITPTSSSSIMKIQFMLNTSCYSGRQLIAALYRNNTCVATVMNQVVSPKKANLMAMLTHDIPNTTIPITYSVRFGIEAGSNYAWWVNMDDSVANIFGGTYNTHYFIKEITLL